MIDNDLPNIISLVMFILWTLIEIVRLYTGYYGNIKESFPEMMSFVVISIISIALLLVNLFVPTVFALEQTIICINLLLTFFEMIWDVVGIAQLYRNHTNMFYLSKSSSSAKRVNVF